MNIDVQYISNSFTHRFVHRGFCKPANLFFVKNEKFTRINRDQSINKVLKFIRIFVLLLFKIVNGNNYIFLCNLSLLKLPFAFYSQCVMSTFSVE